jgi:hypothetical protein
VNRRKLPPADVVIMAAGAVMLIGSFLAFYEVPDFAGSVTVSAWDRGLFMIATLPAFLGTLMALQIGLAAFGNITMPNRVLGLTWDQFHIVLSFQAALLMLAFLAQAKPSFVQYGVGFWLMVGGAGGLVLGALIRVGASRRRPRAL